MASFKGILNFIATNIQFGFNVANREAIKYFESKGLRPTFSYLEMQRDEHNKALTVAKMMDMDMLQDVHDSLTHAMKKGWTYEEWSDRIIPILQANGWWGRQEVTDPVTGKTIIKELGSPHRLKTIFRTNMQQAYMVGRWQQIMQTAKERPYLRYDAIDDSRTRPKHRKWDGTILPFNHKWWRTHYPPCGYNCRCSITQFSKADLEAYGLEVTENPDLSTDGIDTGFDYNAGLDHWNHLQDIASQKAQNIKDEALRKAAQESLSAIQSQAKDVKSLKLNNGKSMDAGAGSGAMGRFADLDGESLGGQQAYQDALQLTGLPVDVQVVDKKLPVFTPMRYSLSDNLIEVNSLTTASRSVRVQEMAEELLHAVDHLGDGYTLSAGSPLLDMKTGVVMQELLLHYQQGGYFKEFFDYPLHIDNQFKDDRIKAEVFARLGVLYFAHPEVLKRELTKAYEVYHELFGLSKISPVNNEYVRSKVWATTRGAAQNGVQSSAKQKHGGDDARGIGKESARELGRLRNAIAKVLKSPEMGKKADL